MLTQKIQLGEEISVLAKKLAQEGKEVLLCYSGLPEKLSQANNYYVQKADNLGIETLFLDEESSLSSFLL